MPSCVLVEGCVYFQIQDLLNGPDLLAPCCGVARGRHLTNLRDHTLSGWEVGSDRRLVAPCWRAFVASMVGGVLTPGGLCCSRFALVLAVWSS